MELRWDGIRSLADAMRMLKRQLDRTPAPQWVRVIGGFTAHPILPKSACPRSTRSTRSPRDTPVFLLHLDDRALLNGAAVRAVGTPRARPTSPAARIVPRPQTAKPTGLLIATAQRHHLYATLAKGPKLPPEYQKNSPAHFMREVNDSA